MSQCGAKSGRERPVGLGARVAPDLCGRFERFRASAGTRPASWRRLIAGPVVAAFGSFLCALHAPAWVGRGAGVIVLGLLEAFAAGLGGSGYQCGGLTLTRGRVAIPAVARAAKRGESPERASLLPTVFVAHEPREESTEPQGVAGNPGFRQACGAPMSASRPSFLLVFYLTH